MYKITNNTEYEKKLKEIEKYFNKPDSLNPIESCEFNKLMDCIEEYEQLMWPENTRTCMECNL